MLRIFLVRPAVLPSWLVLSVIVPALSVPVPPADFEELSPSEGLEHAAKADKAIVIAKTYKFLSSNP